MSKTLRWTLGISLSIGLHAVAGAVMLLPSHQPPEVMDGGPAVEMAALGDASEDALQAGTPSEVLTPSESPTELADIDPLAPTEPLQETLPPETVQSEPPPDILPDSPVPPDVPVPSVEADVLLPQESLPPVSQTPPEVVAALPPEESVVPQIRPEVAPPKPVIAKKAEPKPEKPPQKPRRERPVVGEGGKAAVSSRKGDAEAEETGSGAVMSAGGAGKSMDPCPAHRFRRARARPCLTPLRLRPCTGLSFRRCPRNLAVRLSRSPCR